MGFDRSMVLAYGQDDRVCAYTSLVAMLEVDKVKRTTCCLLVDKRRNWFRWCYRHAISLL